MENTKAEVVKSVQAVVPGVNLRPKREQFKFNVVIGNNGARVDEAQIAKHITETETKLRRKQMKEAGWTSVKIFNKDSYVKAFESYRAERKLTAQNTRVSMIGEAFESADVDGRNTRVERALNALLPLYVGVNDRKVIDAFKKIVRTVAASTPNYIEKMKSVKLKEPELALS